MRHPSGPVSGRGGLLPSPRASIAGLLVLAILATGVFGAGQDAAARRPASSTRTVAGSASSPGMNRIGDADAPTAMPGKARPDASPQIGKKKFPWLLVGAVAVVGIVAAVLLLKKKGSSSGSPDGATGSIRVESDPAGASVFRNDRDTGLKTNVTLAGVPVGTHTIKLVLDGYNDYIQTVEVVQGQTVEVKAKMVIKGVLEPALVRIPGGTFWMGSTSEEALLDERPVHQVTLSSFQIGRFEVTQEEWVSVMGTNPSFFRGDLLPVDNLQWDDIQPYLQRLNELTGKSYRLPTEAEWEYACRAGTTGDRYGALDAVAWYQGNSGGTTHDVGGKVPNAYGLYDMLGNVFEWCFDWYGEYSPDPVTNPQGPSVPTPGTIHHIIRGGSWLLEALAARASFRSLHVPAHKADVIGFRVAMN